MGKTGFLFFLPITWSIWHSVSPYRLTCSLNYLYSPSLPLPLFSEMSLSYILAKQLGQDSMPTLVPGLRALSVVRIGDSGWTFGKEGADGGICKARHYLFWTSNPRLRVNGPTTPESWPFSVVKEGSFDPRLCLSFSQSSKFGRLSFCQDRMIPPTKQSCGNFQLHCCGGQSLAKHSVNW